MKVRDPGRDDADRSRQSASRDQSRYYFRFTFFGRCNAAGLDMTLALVPTPLLPPVTLTKTRPVLEEIGIS